MERFSLNKLNEVEGKEQYPVEISNRFGDLEKLNDSVDIYRAWETIRKTTNISAKESVEYYKLKKHKPWCSRSVFKTVRPVETSQTAVVTGFMPNKL
jgi:hypothetical protein